MSEEIGGSHIGKEITRRSIVSRVEPEDLHSSISKLKAENLKLASLVRSKEDELDNLRIHYQREIDTLKLDLTSSRTSIRESQASLSTLQTLADRLTFTTFTSFLEIERLNLTQDSLTSTISLLTQEIQRLNHKYEETIRTHNQTIGNLRREFESELDLALEERDSLNENQRRMEENSLKSEISTLLNEIKIYQTRQLEFQSEFSTHQAYLDQIMTSRELIQRQYEQLKIDFEDLKLKQEWKISEARNSVELKESEILSIRSHYESKLAGRNRELESNKLREDHQIEISTYISRLTSLESQLSFLSKENEELKVQLQSIHETCEREKREMIGRERRRSESESVAKDQEKRFAVLESNYKAMIDSRDIEIADLKSQILSFPPPDSNYEISKLKSSLSSFETRIEELNLRHSNEVSHLRNELIYKEQILTGIMAEKIALEKSKNNTEVFSIQLQSLKSENESLSQDYSLLYTQLFLIMLELERTHLVKDELASLNAKLLRELIESDEERASLEKEMDAMELELKNLRYSKEKTIASEDNSREFKLRIIELENKCVLLTTELERLNSIIKDKSKDIVMWKTRFEDCEYEARTQYESLISELEISGKFV